MQNLFFRVRRIDWPLAWAVCATIAIGLLAISSVDLSRGDGFDLLKRQLLASVIGIVCFFVLSSFHPEVFRASSRWWYALGLALLIGVLVVGQTIHRTRGWFVFGGFSFQPVEFMKVALLITLARVIDRRARAFQTALFFFGTLVVACVPIAFVMAQPDLGGALVLAALWLWLVLFVGTKRTYVVMLMVVGIALVSASWFVLLKPYQKDRVLTFLNRDRDIRGAGYNVEQSIIAVGSGGLFGRGYGYGSQSQLNFVPEHQTDFIISVIGEELGFVGMCALIVCYVIIGWRLTKCALAARDDFTLAVVIGVMGLWMTQIVVNIGGALGSLPETGITLPFVSYGGSSLVMNFVLLGIVQSIASHQVFHR